MDRRGAKLLLALSILVESIGIVIMLNIAFTMLVMGVDPLNVLTVIGSLVISTGSMIAGKVFKVVKREVDEPSKVP